MYDEDTGLVMAAGKGDASIWFLEMTDEVKAQQRSAAFLLIGFRAASFLSSSGYLSHQRASAWHRVAAQAVVRRAQGGNPSLSEADHERRGAHTTDCAAHTNRVFSRRSVSAHAQHHAHLFRTPSGLREKHRFHLSFFVVGGSMVERNSGHTKAGQFETKRHDRAVAGAAGRAQKGQVRAKVQGSGGGRGCHRTIVCENESIER